jgi:hypothetical protein
VRRVDEENVAVSKMVIEPVRANLLNRVRISSMPSSSANHAIGNGSTQAISPTPFFATAALATSVEKPEPTSKTRFGFPIALSGRVKFVCVSA